MLDALPSKVGRLQVARWDRVESSCAAPLFSPSEVAMEDGATSGAELKLIQRWENRSRRRADRRETRRAESPRLAREVTTPDGLRFALVAHERGFPEPQRQLRETLWFGSLPLVDDLLMLVDVKRWLAYRWKHRRAWLIRIETLDDRGDSTKLIQTVVVDSREEAQVAVADISNMLSSTGEAALVESIARGKYRAA